MKRYKVVLRPRALRQLAEIERWIETEASADVAHRYGDAIVAYCRKLDTFPDRGRPRDDLRAGMRTVVYRGAVTIGYVVEGEEVHVVGIASRGRDIDVALKD